MFDKLVALSNNIQQAKSLLTINESKEERATRIAQLEREYELTAQQYERYLDGLEAGSAYHNNEQYTTMPSRDEFWLIGFDRAYAPVPFKRH